jgi:hypothetical protein
MPRFPRLLIAATLTALSAPAAANDDGFEIWLNPAVEVALDKNTGVELETAQRLRNSGQGRDDTYFFRFWVNQELSDRWTLSAAVERRINDGGRDETRTMQQLSFSKGVLRARARLEQRFVDDADRMGLRLRTRVGVKVPLDEGRRLAAFADAEPFWTLVGTSRRGDTGLTGLRTQIGLAYDVSDKIGISVGYLRQQDIVRGGPDTVGHAPILGLTISM